MKPIVKSFCVWTVCLCLLVGGLAVSAERWNYEDGVVPENWTHITSRSEVTATNILGPVNPNASQEAKNLYAYLCKLSDSDSFLTGQFDIANTNRSYEIVTEDFGFEPALYSARYVVNAGSGSDCSITRSAEPDEDGLYDISYPDDLLLCTDDSVEKVNNRMKQHYDNGNVLLIHSDSADRTVCGRAAVLRGKYSSANDAIIELDITNPDRDMDVYALWYRYQTDVMENLQKLEDMGVKAYLWRPWIEYNYSGFTGVTDEGREAFVRVFQQTVERMIDFGLTGFLVTYSPGGNNDTLTRNPGNDYVDSYSVTCYSDSGNLGRVANNNHSNYLWYVRTGKPIGLSEVSCRTGIWQDVEKQARASSYDLLSDLMTVYPRLSWINYWGDASYSPWNCDKDLRSGNDDGRMIMDSPYTLTLEEIPDYRDTAFTAPGVAQVRLKGESAGVYHGLEEREYSLSELKTMGIDPTRVETVRANDDYSIAFYTGDNCTGQEYCYVGSAKNLSADVTASFKSCRIALLQNLALDKDIWASDNDEDSYKANDGLLSLWEGTVGADGTCWLYVDLGEICNISYYTVRNAGATQRADMYNTRGFRFQYSHDAENWVTVSQVSNNTASVVTRNIEPVKARYFRLLITDPNKSVIASDAGIAMICELELYGVVVGGEEEIRQPDDDNNAGASEDGDMDWGIDNGNDTDADDTEKPEDDDGNSTTRKKVIRKVVVGSNTWIIMVAVAAGVAVLGGGTGLFFFLRRRKKMSEVK